MSQINKLVIYTSEDELEKHAAGYPCLVNYNPFLKTGQIDDGCGHYAEVTFIAMDPNAPTAIPAGEFHNVVLVGPEWARGMRPAEAPADEKE